MKVDYILLIFCLVLLIAFILIRSLKMGVRSLVLKTATSLAICASGMILSYEYGLTKYGLIMIIGMMFGVVGDNVLDLKMMYKDDAWKYLYYGFISFGIGHIIYTIGMTNLINDVVPKNELIKIMLILIIPSIVFSLLSIKGMELFKLKFGKDKLITIIYTCFLTYTTLFSLYLTFVNTKYLVLFIGFFLFLLSDGVLSFIYFGGKEKSLFFAILNHVLYYAAQIIIIFSIAQVI